MCLVIIFSLFSTVMNIDITKRAGGKLTGYIPL